ARAQARVIEEKIEARVFEWIDKNTTLNSTTIQCLNAPPPLADLLDQTAHLILHYAKLPVSELAVLCACWVALTYTCEHFRYCGYLALRSATPRCGKTRLLRMIALLALGHPSITTTPTAPVLFRGQRTVLLLDEVDRLRNSDKENFGAVLAILNVGFEKGAVVERMEKTRG